MKRTVCLAALAAVAVALLGACAVAQTSAAARTTQYPATRQPDLVTLTWAGDPTSSISVQWRTDATVTTGSVGYAPAARFGGFGSSPAKVVAASAEVIRDAGLPQQPVVMHHTARLTGLAPGTEYVYAVRNGDKDLWGGQHSFRTAPATGEAPLDPFCFVYLGDAQYGFSRWGAVQRAAWRERPDVAFFLMAGDLVTRGNDRDDWDDLLSHAEGVYADCPVVPAMGNHEYKGEKAPRIYRQQFDLPRNGPAGVDPEHAYALEYGNLLVLVLDSNLPPEAQAPWLEQQLAQSKATWKTVMFHHPLYSSDPDRNNKELRETWGPIFDKHHVDIVFQGHDHAYLRTHPMKAEKPVATAAEGTIYLVSVSGTKMYEQGDFDYTAVGFTDTATYSLIDVLPATEKAADKLVCRAYDLEGNLRDEFSIEKAAQ